MSACWAKNAPCADLPGRLDGWDAFIIRSAAQSLTEATNPVEGVYEMLATGKPVVAVGLPRAGPDRPRRA